MANKDLVQRFQEAFKDPDKVNAGDYQKIIEENSMKASENAERLTFLLLSLVTVFYLILQGGINKIDFGVVEISDFASVLLMLPVLVSYTHYDLVTTISKFNRLSIIYKVIVKQRHEPIYVQKITNYFMFSPTLYEYKNTSAGKFSALIQSVLWIFQFLAITVFIPFGFQIYSFSTLINIYQDAHPVLLFVSLVISVLFGLQSSITTMALISGAIE